VLAADGGQRWSERRPGGLIDDEHVRLFRRRSGHGCQLAQPEARDARIARPEHLLELAVVVAKNCNVHIR
jgi:hypothetical protein